MKIRAKKEIFILMDLLRLSFNLYYHASLGKDKDDGIELIIDNTLIFKDCKIIMLVKTDAIISSPTYHNYLHTYFPYDCEGLFIEHKMLDKNLIKLAASI